MKTQITIGWCAATLLIIAVVGGHYGIAQTPIPQPPQHPLTHVDAWEIAVRTVGEAKITDKTKRIGVEVVRDGTDGTLIYISETGSIAAVPAK